MPQTKTTKQMAGYSSKLKIAMPRGIKFKLFVTLILLCLVFGAVYFMVNKKEARDTFNTISGDALFNQTQADQSEINALETTELIGESAILDQSTVELVDHASRPEDFAESSAHRQIMTDQIQALLQKTIKEEYQNIKLQLNQLLIHITQQQQQLQRMQTKQSQLEETFKPFNNMAQDIHKNKQTNGQLLNHISLLEIRMDKKFREFNENQIKEKAFKWRVISIAQLGNIYIATLEDRNGQQFNVAKNEVLDGWRVSKISHWGISIIRDGVQMEIKQ